MIRRHYIETTDVTDSTEAQVGLAESIVDDYVGYQEKSVKGFHLGHVSAVATGKVYDTNSDSPLDVTDNSFQNCVIEIIAGTGKGQVRCITASDQSDKSITFTGDAFSPALDTTSLFRIYQLAKFPRCQDVHVHDSVFYKVIPDAVKEACKAQVEFIQDMGDDYFNDDSSDVNAESIGNYAYNNVNGSGSASQSALVKLISPRARTLLRGIKNRGGRLIAGNPTCL